MTETGFDRARPLDRLHETARRMQDRYLRWRLYRRTWAELSGLSDRDLADLGLHRSMLKRVAWIAAHET